MRPDPTVVRKLAECLELLPKYINSPQKMPFVQVVIQMALEQINSDREALVQGLDALTRGDELGRKSLNGRKYNGEIRAGLPDPEKYRQPVTAFWLSDSDQKVLEAGFEADETGVFEILERQAAMVAEWLKERRHPRDAELFRNRFRFACGEALLHSQGVEVSPGVYRLDLSTWETEVAKPLSDDLRELAEELEAEPNPLAPTDKPSWSRVNGKLSFDGEVIRTIRRIGNATNVVLVLDTFQELGWPDRVDSPLSGGGQQHHATIDSLNKGLSRIRFRSDGEGKGFIWKNL